MFPSVRASEVVIGELMAISPSSLQDEDGDRPDWVWACWMNQGENHHAFTRYDIMEADRESGTLLIIR